MQTPELTIPVNDPEYGSFNIIVPELSKRSWFGKYQTGLLSIYRGGVVDGPDIKALTIVYVLSEQDLDSLNLIGFTMYTPDVSFPAAVTHVCKTIDAKYAEVLMEIRNDISPILH